MQDTTTAPAESKVDNQLNPDAGTFPIHMMDYENITFALDGMSGLFAGIFDLAEALEDNRGAKHVLIAIAYRGEQLHQDMREAMPHGGRSMSELLRTGVV